MSSLELVKIPVPSAGMNTVSQPGLAPTRTAPLVRNFTVHTPGKLAMRGGLLNTPYAALDTNAVVTAPRITSGIWAFNNKVLLGYPVAANSTEKYVPSHVAPYYKATEAKQLSVGNTKAAFGDIKGASVSSVTVTAEQTPTGNGARLEKYVYGYGLSGASSETVNGGLQWKTPLLRWDGTATAPTKYTHAPLGGQGIKTYLERIFVLGGTDPGASTPVEIGTGMVTKGSKIITELDFPELDKLSIGATISGTGIPEGTTIVNFGTKSKPAPIFSEPFIEMSAAGSSTAENTNLTVTAEASPIEPNTLFWSDEGGPVNDAIDRWRDDVSGLTNKIIVGSDDQNDYGVQLAVVNQTLIIFKRHSIWALYGYSPETFQVRNLTQERGCIDPYSVCEVDGGVFFFSQKGLEFYNGSEFKTVDDGIADITRPIAEFHSGENGVHNAKTDFGRIQVTYFDNDYIFVTISGQNPITFASGEIENHVWAGYMHITSSNWAEFTSPGLGGTGIAIGSGRAGGVPYLWDGRYLRPAPLLTEPYSPLVTVSGEAFVLEHPLLDESASGTKFGIPATFNSDRIELASPGYMAQLHRFLFDYKFSSSAVSDEAATEGWLVTINGPGKLITGPETAEGPLMTERSVPAQGYDPVTLFKFGRRYEADGFPETTSAELSVRWNPAKTTALEHAEVYDSVLEIQTTRQRRSL